MTKSKRKMLVKVFWLQSYDEMFNMLKWGTAFVVLMIATGISGCADSPSIRPMDNVRENPSGLDGNAKIVESAIKRPSASLSPIESKIFTTNATEDLILELSPKLRLVGKYLQGSQAELDSVFSSVATYRGLDTFDLLEEIEKYPTDQNHLQVHFVWPLAESVQPFSFSQFWVPLLTDFEFEDTQFGVVQGDFLPDADVFRMKTVFEGKFRDTGQRPFGVKAKQVLDWIPIGDGQWKIQHWQQTEFNIVFAPKPLFENVTANVVTDSATLEALTRSEHAELILEKFATGTVNRPARPGFRYFNDWESTFQFPGVSIADIDRDGWDDVFVVDRWGKAILLRNVEGKKFEDITEQAGLQIEGSANCSLFADFDNDGDADLFVGRGLESCLFFRNENGRFVEDQPINQILREIRFVVSASVADVNHDGLLDVYLSTYAYSRANPRNYLPYAVRYEDEEPTFNHIRAGHRYLHRGGPPNVLLMNRGGNLERANIDDTLKQWMNSYQSVWHDVDHDGDQDLYVCNDFAPDVFLRNDTSIGSFEPRFTDFTGEVFPGGTMGFGMGANWGDYNRDGQLDLYVSNMYSKAGQRVMQQMGGDVDPRIRVAAQGNFLFENQNGRFKQVAGIEPDQQHVSKVGWSFGGQLADLNNDSRLDVYVPSGYFSVPPQLYSEVDL